MIPAAINGGTKRRKPPLFPWRRHVVASAHSAETAGAPVFMLLERRLLESRMSQGCLFRDQIHKHLIPDHGFEHREEHHDGKVIKVRKTEFGFGLNIRGFKELELAIPVQTMVPG